MTASRPEGAKGTVEERAFQACADLRCFVTGHLVGTDTWTEGTWCQCDSCFTVTRVATLVRDYAREQVEAARLQSDLVAQMPGRRCVRPDHNGGDGRQYGYICGGCAFEMAQDEANAATSDLRAQLQTLRGDYKEAREELQRVLGLLMDQDDKVEALTQEKAALEARERALREELAKIHCPLSGGRAGVWCSTHQNYHCVSLDAALAPSAPKG